jgi:signal transduction histidine kinase
MPRAALSTLASPLSPSRQEREARTSANRKIGFIAHAIVYSLGCLLIFVAGGFLAGLIVLITWSIALASHGFFSVVAPALRSRWIGQDLSKHRSTTSAERAETESRHARSLAELSAAIAHEIRNPITAAKSLVQQIAEDPAAPENREYANVAVQELDRVERSISHLLRFAREEPKRVSTTPLGEVIRAAARLLDERISQHGIELICDTERAGTAEADPEQLRRVIANLIGNAIDALSEARTGSPRIEIHAGENLAGTEAWITVADNGPGIAPEAMSKIFTPFYTSKKTGTGLGLALSRKILEEHGGRLDVKSEPGSGAEFVITLPTRTAAGEGR